jgi:hypothetical protein
MSLVSLPEVGCHEELEKPQQLGGIADYPQAGGLPGRSSDRSKAFGSLYLPESNPSA